eukprot:3212626-Prymnesium_polylepis.1
MERDWPEIASALAAVLAGGVLPQQRWLRVFSLVHRLCSGPKEHATPHQLYSSLRDVLSTLSGAVGRRLAASPSGTELLLTQLLRRVGALPGGAAHNLPAVRPPQPHVGGGARPARRGAASRRLRLHHAWAGPLAPGARRASRVAS